MKTQNGMQWSCSPSVCLYSRSQSAQRAPFRISIFSKRSNTVAAQVDVPRVPSKFTAQEWGPYKRKFVDRRGSEDEFERAWLHHIHANDHHWQHWILGGKAVEMPESAVREMVADWYGAGIAISGQDDLVAWYAKQDSIELHPATRSIDRLVCGHPTLGESR